MDAALVEALTAQLKVLSDQLAKKDEQIQLLSQLVLQKDELIVAKDLRIKELEQASADKDYRPPSSLSSVCVSSSFPLLNLESKDTYASIERVISLEEVVEVLVDRVRNLEQRNSKDSKDNKVCS